MGHATQNWVIIFRKPYHMDRFWVIIVDMSVKAFEPQAFERAVIGALLLEMKRQNMSRRTLAERAGISKSRVIRLFADGGPTSPVTLTVLESICRALRVPMSSILASAEREMESSAARASILDTARR